MYKLKDFLSLLEQYAPLEISRKAIESGDYDNSGIIVNSHDQVNSVLFTLDLSVEAVKAAIKLNADTVVTHHPAIYNPIKSLDKDGDTAALLLAVENHLNVVSMHLNLDMASLGIDHYLAKGLGGENTKILQPLSGLENGYGREFSVNCDAEKIKQRAEEVFGSKKIILYGLGAVEKAASFCGGGSGHALDAVEKGETDADLIITSDVPHHVLKELIERGKKVMIIPHYVSEQYGFNKFYEWTLDNLKGLKAYYFEDKRFM